MAITTTADRRIFEEKTRFQGFLDATSETIATTDCWLLALTVHNSGATDQTFTLADRGAPSVSLFSLYRVTANATDRDTLVLTANDAPIYLPNGFSIFASAGAQLHVRGVFAR
jgi:hypothetical protein